MPETLAEDIRERDGHGRVVHALPALLPAAAVTFFAFRSGGFFPDAPGLVAAGFAIVLVLRVTLAERPLAGVSPATLVLLGALTLLGVLQLASSSWSHAAGRAIVEYDRTLAYLLGAAALATFARSPARLAAGAYALLAAITAACCAALLSRLAPDLLHVAPGPVPGRLSYPLTYWNALGVFGSVGVVVAFGLTTSAREPRVVRVLAAAAVPLLATTVLLTLSRGGILAGIAGVLVVLVVGRPEGAPGGIAAAAVGAGIPLLGVLQADVLTSPRYASAAGQAEGHHVALLLALGVVLAAVLRAGALVLDGATLAWLGRRRTAPMPAGRRVALAAGAAAVVVAVALAAGGAGFVHRQYENFVHGGLTASSGTNRLLDASANGRIDVWRVSLDGFRDHPLHGTGAGTFQTRWTQGRSDQQSVIDAHSLYLEVVGELGLPGLLLVLAAVLMALWGFARHLPGRERAVPAALLGAGIAWALHAGVDWDWEMPATGFWLFALGGLGLARPAGEGRRWAPGRVARVVTALGCLVLAVVPLLVVGSQTRLDRAATRLADGDCAGAVDSALGSIDALGSRPEPYEILGFCDARLGSGPLAVRALRHAVERDRQWWVTWYGLALVQGYSGQDPRAAARRALELDPKEALTRTAVREFRHGTPRTWPRIAARLPLPQL